MVLQMLLSALTQVLGAFHNLTYLDLSPTNVDGVRGQQNEAEERSLCSSWASVCASLRRVKFPSGTEWIFAKEREGGTCSWRPKRPPPPSRR